MYVPELCMDPSCVWTRGLFATYGRFAASGAFAIYSAQQPSRRLYLRHGWPSSQQI
ncbi:hypothetical protein EJ02DRAFT_454614 [Clathrospora elynae]|uniref:Uncharacterized protein n=1 Tax=Clathrospora elynae TaxID=706981 RepID=A0A6A5SPW8_9PLEO|nr:hypothetical protein EJ02DRAFT_461125 [Clathrospora elynae]KAF1942123.1 hypothetical protein EJ02DRAFT_454614 [Clathrospora elynae]